MGGASGSTPAEGRSKTVWVERAERRRLQIPLRHRSEGQEEWTQGEMLNLSETGLLFSSETILEVGVRIEITFQISSPPLLPSSTRLARIVRRVLSNWPDTKPMFGAKFCS